MNVITKSVQLPDGRTITIETGKVAKQADGAAVLRMGNTVLLATVCAAKDAVPGTDFMPLQVDYREQYSAAGRSLVVSPSAKAKPAMRKSLPLVLWTVLCVHFSLLTTMQKFTYR